MLKLLVISLGGAVGALLRYWVSGWIYRYSGGMFPWGTLAVNLIGCLVIGFLWGLFEGLSVASNIKLFVFIGILGSFTTFSTFALENFNMIRDGEYGSAFLNIAVSAVFGIALVFTGVFAARFILSFFK